MYTIYLGSTVVQFVYPPGSLPAGDDVLYLHTEPGSNLLQLIETVEKNPGLSKLCLGSEEPEVTFQRFTSNYRLIEAGGGLVQNELGQTLLIYRLGKWDLPKGKIEKGETISEASLREVREECGISTVKIVNPLPSTYHTYLLNGERILKKTHWFEMQTSDTSPLVPQENEGITQAAWMNVEQIKSCLSNTYPAIRELLSGK